MNELTVTGQATQVTSLQISEWTGKEHKHVMRDIRNEIEELGEIGESIFGLTSYLDNSNRQSPCYTMTKKGVMQLALKYDAVSRFKCIEKLEELEHASQHQIPKTYSAALLEAGRLAILLEEASQQLEIAAPKTDFYDKFVSSDETMSIADFCKTISCQLNKPIGRNRLFKILREFKALTAKNEATQHMVERGLMVNKITLYIDLDEIQHSEIQPRITPKGFEYILNRLISLKIIKLKQV